MEIQEYEYQGEKGILLHPLPVHRHRRGCAGKEPDGAVPLPVP